MHEYVYADKILQTVLEEVGTRRKPSSVEVEVGEMLGLTRASLGTAYEVLAKGTPAEGSKLLVKFARGSVHCQKCDYEGRLPVKRHEHRIDPAFSCPKCGASLNVITGLEVELKGIQWEGQNREPV
jgi:hydrogenase nickel incorporation protein HypA/HybF